MPPQVPQIVRSNGTGDYCVTYSVKYTSITSWS